jgi:hypothetical protein
MKPANQSKALFQVEFDSNKEVQLASIDPLWKEWLVIRQRMDDYGKTIPPGREIAARYALIDPILRVLGWDLSNPHQVSPSSFWDRGKMFD